MAVQETAPDSAATTVEDAAGSAADPVAGIEAAILTLLRRANDPRGNQRIRRLAGSDLERAGAVMLARVEELEPARLSDLACAVGVEMSTASRQVGRLVEQGYLRRDPDPEDARATRIRLTRSGRALRGRLRAAVRTWFESALAGLSGQERETLAELLGRLIAGIEEQDRTHPG